MSGPAHDGQDPGHPSSDALKSTSPGSARATWLLVGLATLLAFGLAFHQLGHDSLWGDEFETWQWAQLPFDRILWATALHHHPPIYFWFLHGWVRIGAAPLDEVWLRLPSAFFFALTVPMAYSIGRALSGTSRAGVYAAFLVATFPLLLHYGQEARSYAMLTFFAACGFAAVAHLACRSRARERPRFMRGPLLRPPRPRFLGAGLRAAWRPAARGEFRAGWHALGDDGLWGVYIVSSLAVMGLHNTAGIYPLVTGLILLCAVGTAPSFRGLRFANLCIATALIALMYSPYLPALRLGMEGLDISHRRTTPDMDSVFSVFAGAYGHPHLPEWGGIFLVVLSGLAGFALMTWVRRGEWHRVAFAGLGWLGALAFLTIFSFWKPILHPKLLLWTLPPFLAACAAGLALVPWRFVRLGLLAGLLAVNLVGVARVWSHMNQDWRGMAEIVARDASPGTAVLHCSSDTARFVRHYLSRMEAPPEFDFYGLSLKRDKSHPGHLVTATFRRLRPGGPAGFEPARLFPRYQRVWLGGNCGERWMDGLRAALSERGKRVETRELSSVSLFLYERKE